MPSDTPAERLRLVKEVIIKSAKGYVRDQGKAKKRILQDHDPADDKLSATIATLRAVEQCNMFLAKSHYDRYPKLAEVVGPLRTST